MIVVDASVALAWCLKDEGSDYADVVFSRVASGGGAAAPAHWPLEVANGLLSAERRGRLDAQSLVHAARLLDRAGVEIVHVELNTAAWSIVDSAREYDLSVYEAGYLDLARFRNVALATLDKRLRDACKRAGVPVAD